MNEDFRAAETSIDTAESWLEGITDRESIATAQVYATLAVAEAIIAASLRAQQSPPECPPSPAGTGALDASG
jgi:hypothetical protein